jgi:hypothetical protein
MADDLFQLLHGLGAGEFTGFYRGTGAAAHWFYRVHVARVADGLVLPHAPALVLSFLTVVFVFSYVFRGGGRVDGVLQNGFFMQQAEAAFYAVHELTRQSDDKVQAHRDLVL